MERAAWAILLGILLAAPARAASAPLPVTRHALTEKNAIYDIDAAYPQTGDAGIDADLLATVQRIAKGFAKEAKAAHDPSEPPYTLDVTYKIARNDARAFAVVFNDEWDFRGAHPNLEIVTANYVRDGSWRVYLPELFDGKRALARISALATADLDKRLLGPDAYTDKDWIARGASPHWDNFGAFVLEPDRLEIIFPPYQVAAYVAGPQTAGIPLAKLADVMRKDPRAPVPSFDCARAATPDEHAICSDVMLARLDRQVADSWSSEERNENDPLRKARLKTDQVAWLNQRDNICRAAASRVACLTALYQARLKALEEGE